MSVGFPNDVYAAPQGFDSAGTDSTTPAEPDALPMAEDVAAPAGQALDGPLPSEPVDEFVFGDNDVEWLQSGGFQRFLDDERGRQWVTQNRQLLEPYFQQDKANLQRTFSQRENAYQQQVRAAQDDAQAWKNYTAAVFAELERITQEHSIEYTDRDRDALLARAHRSEAQYAQERSQQQYQLNENVNRAYAMANKEAADFGLNAQDPRLQQPIQDFIATYSAVLAQPDGPLKTQLMTELNRKQAVYRQAFRQAAGTPPPTQPAQAPAPVQQAPQRGPQRMAGRGGGSAPRPHHEVFDQGQQALIQRYGSIEQIPIEDQMRLWAEADRASSPRT